MTSHSYRLITRALCQLGSSRSGNAFAASGASNHEIVASLYDKMDQQA